MELVDKMLRGDVRALARLITIVENDGSQAKTIMKELYRHTGKAQVIGVTGAPGVGKSTLVDRLAAGYRESNRTVGVIAVDPTSPFTGGAILGDRIRMQPRSSDDGLFIRSLATRGHLGGLSRATGDVIKLMDASGRDVVMVETVGAGQSEVDIMRYAQTVLVVVVPGLGDDIQAIKAGILEIGDIFVVNKADREGADRTVMELQMMLELNPQKGDWVPPIIRAVARDGTGVPEILDSIESHRNFLENSGLLYERRARETRESVRDIIVSEVTRRLWEDAVSRGELEELLRRVAERQLDPYSAAERIISSLVPSAHRS